MRLRSMLGFGLAFCQYWFFSDFERSGFRSGVFWDDSLFRPLPVEMECP